MIVAETSVGDVRGPRASTTTASTTPSSSRTSAGSKTCGICCSTATCRRAQERDAFRRRDRARCVASPTRCRPVLPEIARASSSVMEGLRTALSLDRRGRGLQADARHPADERRAQRAAAVRGHADADHGDAPLPRRPRADRAARRPRLRRQLPVDARRARSTTPTSRRAVEQYQITTIDHGFNASTFTARVIVSTGADVGAAVVGGIGALSGPLHGGAPFACARPARRDRHARERAAVPGRRWCTRGEKIMGFGHRVYKTDDPRRASCTASPSGSERRRSSSPSRSSRPWSTCSPS